MRRIKRTDDGASLVEFALVLPVLTLFLFGIVQFGIAYDRQQSVNSAAREGARIGALVDTPLEDIVTRSAESYSASVSPTDDLTVTVRDDGGAVVGVGCPGGSYSATPCDSPSGIDQTDEELMPCGDDPQSSFVEIIVATPYEITIPFFGVQNITIDSEAQFRCE